MKTTIDKKQAWLEAMGNHVLEHGLNAASLRPLAKAAGTSDRMLIYHFQSKDQLIKELLKYLFDRLANELTEALPNKRAKTRMQCARDVVITLDSVRYKRYMNVWLEVVANSAHKENVFAKIGHELVDDLLMWITNYLPASEPDPQRAARAILTLLEGVNVLTSVGHADIGQDAIAFLLDDV